MGGLKLVTEAKRLANARNARAPRPRKMLPEPKSRGGYLAREVVVTEGPWRESYREWQQLLEGFREGLCPQGLLEEVLVEKMAVCYWRFRRLLRVESAEIGKNLHSVPDTLEARQLSRSALGLPPENEVELERWLRYEQGASYLPAADTLALLTDYAAVLERGFYRALWSYERLRRIRAGKLTQKNSGELIGAERSAQGGNF